MRALPRAYVATTLLAMLAVTAAAARAALAVAPGFEQLLIEQDRVVPPATQLLLDHRLWLCFGAPLLCALVTLDVLRRRSVSGRHATAAFAFVATCALSLNAAALVGIAGPLLPGVTGPPAPAAVADLSPEECTRLADRFALLARAATDTATASAVRDSVLGDCASWPRSSLPCALNASTFDEVSACMP